MYCFEIDHRADFDDLKILISNINENNSRIFLEDWYADTQPAPMNSACAVPPEYTFFL